MPKLHKEFAVFKDGDLHDCQARLNDCRVCGRRTSLDPTCLILIALNIKIVSETWYTVKHELFGRNIQGEVVFQNISGWPNR